MSLHSYVLGHEGQDLVYELTVAGLLSNLRSDEEDGCFKCADRWFAWPRS